MGTTAGQIERQIADTRDDMESKIVELRERSLETVDRSKRLLLIAVGAGAAIGTAAGIGYLVYRMTRPPTVEERITRILPGDWFKLIRHYRDRAELRIRHGLPPVRLYVGDRQVGEEAPETALQKLIVLAARTAGTAAATAMASRILGKVTDRTAA